MWGRWWDSTKDYRTLLKGLSKKVTLLKGWVTPTVACWENIFQERKRKKKVWGASAQERQYGLGRLGLIQSATTP